MAYTREEQRANREKWAQELESGAYDQGVGHLRQDDRFCCLGVLCAVAGIEQRGVDSIGVMNYDGRELEAPKSAMDFVGLRTPLGAYRGSHSLADHNDDGWDFGEIAEIIRDEPSGLFLDD